MYMTRGVDLHGHKWEANRRYNEFFSLREAQSRCWPGLFLPYMPSKKLVGNRDVKFIVQRRYFLERYYMQMSRFAYLTHTQEWQTFCRPNQLGGDLTK